jgi:hypothetical protein
MEYGSYGAGGSTTILPNGNRPLYLDEGYGNNIPCQTCINNKKITMLSMCLLWTFVVLLAVASNNGSTTTATSETSSWIGGDTIIERPPDDDTNNNNEDNHQDNNDQPSSNPVISNNNSSKFTSQILTNLRDGKLCSSWSRDLIQRFEQKCSGYWIEELATWSSHTHKHASIGPSVYSCVDEGLCHGLGDRLSGIQGVLSHALIHDLPLRIHWQGFNRLFESCMFPEINWNEEPPPSHGCELDTSLCARVETFTCEPFKSKPKTFFNLDRACLPSPTCKILKQQFPSTINAANVYGCPLRVLFEPSVNFRTSIRVPFRVGNDVQLRTVGEIEQIMAKYYVIGIHFRLGDNAAFKNPDSKIIDEDHHQYLVPFHCADTIQSYLEHRTPVRNTKNPVEASGNLTRDDMLHDEYKVGGKPVRWFVASDAENLKELAVKLYQNKLLMVDLAPHHIAFAKPHNGEAKVNILGETFSEWYLLGLSDKLILNRYGVGLFQGRISSFPKTSWVYQLKHEFYDAGKCVEKEFPLDGTWSVADKNCRPSNGKKLQKPLQPHLDPLKDIADKYEFPQVWVKDGTVMKINGV